jgi:hypothetical protein
MMMVMMELCGDDDRVVVWNPLFWQSLACARSPHQRSPSATSWDHPSLQTRVSVMSGPSHSHDDPGTQSTSHHSNQAEKPLPFCLFLPGSTDTLWAHKLGEQTARHAVACTRPKANIGAVHVAHALLTQTRMQGTADTIVQAWKGLPKLTHASLTSTEP